MQQFTGLQYLKIDIANNFGLDKEDWNPRIDWVNTNEANLESFVKQADEPALFYAAVMAYRAVQQGKAIGYPISLDACCSGLQILATLIGCKDSAALCGVIDTGHRADAYTTLYIHMCEMLGQGTTIKRADTKNAIMTALYGSTAIPKRVFGEGEQYAVFNQTMETKAKGAWELNKALQELWDTTKTRVAWQLPDGFTVDYEVRTMQTEVVHFLNTPYEVTTKVNAPKSRSKELGPNIVHSIDGMIVREMVRRCSYDPAVIQQVVQDIESKEKSTDRTKDKMVMKLWNYYTLSGFLSSAIFNYLDAKNMGHVDTSKILDMISTLPNKPFQLITVHDCFRCLPNYGNDVRRQYNRIMHEIGKSELLSFIVSQYKGVHTPVRKFGDFGDLLLDANYMLS